MIQNITNYFENYIITAILSNAMQLPTTIPLKLASLKGNQTVNEVKSAIKTKLN